MNDEIEEHIRRNVTWAQLPNHVKQIFANSAKNYDKVVTSFSIKNQLRYRGNLVRHVLRDERRYYERVVAFSRERLMLFPYHLADMVVKGLRITPFNYYISVVEKLMQAEKSYDTLPNFTAADCLRLLGIGRNEYIDLMNKSRTNRSKLFGKRNVSGLLPKVPKDVHIEPWWRVEIGMVLEEDVKMVTEPELEIIDKLIDYGSQTAGELNYEHVLSLYKKGLVYLDVPITAADRVKVPPLQGFVMNRVLGDYFETLLYKIFVSIDEHTTVGELASVLQVDTELVKHAVSLYCRLQFARKLDCCDLELPLVNPRKELHPSWSQLRPVTDHIESVDVTPLTLNLKTPLGADSPVSEPDLLLPDSPASSSEGTLSKRRGQRVAFLFDSALTAFLMMGNLSPGLKKHAVTMFEVGKLCDESLDSFLGELEKVSALEAEGEGEARRFFDHAVILRSTVLALRKLPAAGLDLVRLESLHSLDEPTYLRLLQKKYKLLVSMAPLSREVRPICSLAPAHLGPAVPEVNSLWFKLFLYHVTGHGPPSLLLAKGAVLDRLPRMFIGFSKLLVTAWHHEPAVIPASNVLYVNAALQYSAVLIQAYGVLHSAAVRVVPFPFRADTNPKRSEDGESEWLGHPAIRNLQNHVDLDHNCGYITFADIGVLDFGRSPNSKASPLKLSSKLNEHRPGAPVTNNNNNNNDPPAPTAISNENFSFVADKVGNTAGDVTEERLQSPVESHFALTPVGGGSDSSSPGNGFSGGHVCTDLLQEELDQLENSMKLQTATQPIRIDASFSVETLATPSEEHINMFSRSVRESQQEHKTKTCGEEGVNKGEPWTILECHFGVPLFDADANTKICEQIVNGGLTDSGSLERLTESSRKLSTALLEFINQCLYLPDENMTIVKRGRLTPQPRHSLVFDNGKVNIWSGK